MSPTSALLEGRAGTISHAGAAFGLPFLLFFPLSAARRFDQLIDRYERVSPDGDFPFLPPPPHFLLFLFSCARMIRTRRPGARIFPFPFPLLLFLRISRSDADSL